MTFEFVLAYISKLMDKIKTVHFIPILGLIAALAASRLIPHLPNMTPIAAIALFGGAHFEKKYLAFIVSLGALFVSDLLLGFHEQMLSVYLSFAMIVGLGFLVNRQKIVSIAGASLASSTLFFVVTNFSVWMSGALYPKTISGLTTCYIAAIPFFGNTLLGDLFYTGVLFGTFALFEKRFSSVFSYTK